MNWTKLLNAEIEGAFGPTLAMLNLVEDGELDWKPATGSNWMTTGQLLMHLTNACGHCCRGFVTGDWGMPEDASPEDMLPPAEKLPAVESVAQARKLIEADKALALTMVAEAGEEALHGKLVGAPWNPTPMALGHQFLNMVNHLTSHKSQLFYYLKLMGKPVHTGTLWGM